MGAVKTGALSIFQHALKVCPEHFYFIFNYFLNFSFLFIGHFPGGNHQGPDEPILPSALIKARPSNEKKVFVFSFLVCLLSSFRSYCELFLSRTSLPQQNTLFDDTRKLSFWCFHAGLAMYDLMKCGVKTVLLTSGTSFSLSFLSFSFIFPFLTLE